VVVTKVNKGQMHIAHFSSSSHLKRYSCNITNYLGQFFSQSSNILSDLFNCGLKLIHADACDPEADFMVSLLIDPFLHLSCIAAYARK